MNSSRSKPGKDADTDAAMFFSIKVDMCLRCPPPFTLFPSARLLPPSTSICFMRQVKLKIAHLKFVEREREWVQQGKFGAQRRAPNRITLFSLALSCSPTWEGNWQTVFPSDSWDDFDCLRYQSIWCSAKRFNWEIPWDTDRKNIKKNYIPVYTK